MKILIFGKGGLSKAIDRYNRPLDNEVVELSKADVDVSGDYHLLLDQVWKHKPDWIVNAAGLSDLVKGVSVQDVIGVNLIGAINVGRAAAADRIPCIQIASTAGIDPGKHVWYGPAKAGVINYVRAAANRGVRTWAISPGRMDTPMREADFPDEDISTRLNPLLVASVIGDITDGLYQIGANIIIRKVGLERVDVYEEPRILLPSMHV